MNIYSKIIAYLSSFFAFVLLLWVIGLVNSSPMELFSYYSLALGISMVFVSFGNEKRAVLFSGTIIFLLGLFFFIINHFDFNQTDMLIIPSFFFIIGTGFFILYLDNFSNRKNLILSIVLWLLGFLYVLISGEFRLQKFFASVGNVAFSYWTVILLAGGAFILLKNYFNK